MVEQAGASEEAHKHPQAVHRYWLCAAQGRGNLQGTGVWRSILYHQKVRKLPGLSEQQHRGAV